MSFTIIYIILITITIISLIITNPINLGLIILITALLTAPLFSILHSSWIAFLLFLIYVSGILVIFAYFIAVTPNIEIQLLRPFLIAILSLTILIPTIIIYHKIIPTHHESLHLNTLYSPEIIPLLLLLAIILLLTIIIVVKITTLNKGPLRQFLKYV